MLYFALVTWVSQSVVPSALKRIMETEGMDLEIIINEKSLDNGQGVIQLETAAGAAIKHFKGAHGVNVPRCRFLPVKSCSDLLLIKSDIYSLEHGQLVINPSRMFDNIPVIKLGDHFKKVCYPGRIPSVTSDRFFLSRSSSSRSDSRRFQRSLSWIT